MKTSTAIILGVVAVAGVGGFLYWQHVETQKKIAAAKKAAAGNKSTADKIVGAISSALPVVGAITSLFG